MRAFPLPALFAASLVSLAGCSAPMADYKAGDQLSGPPLSDIVFDERELQAPPLDPARKIAEQDCSQPVDITLGNLRCR